MNPKMVMEEQTGQFQFMEDIPQRLSHLQQLAITGRVAASVAHEISNILQSVLLHLGAMADSVAEPAQEHLELSLQEVVHAVEMSRWLLHGARPNHDQRDQVDLVELINQALSLAAGQIRTARVAVEMHVGSEVPKLIVATGAMRQVFLNLVLNAVQAMPHGGKLDIAIRRRDEQVEISFADNGVGIDPADLERVFEPFFTRKDTGSGLGLWLCQYVIAAHGGAIELQSDPGIGTVARLRLPITTLGTPPARELV
jgi:signal transduction histidine kinase